MQRRLALLIVALLVGLLGMGPLAEATIASSSPSITVVHDPAAPNLPGRYLVKLSPAEASIGLHVDKYEVNWSGDDGAHVSSGGSIYPAIGSDTEDLVWDESGYALMKLYACGGPCPDGAVMYAQARMIAHADGGTTFTTPWSTWTPLPLFGGQGVPDCQPLRVIGVRGSGETAGDADGYGGTVAAVIDGLVPLAMNAHAVNYPAVAVNFSDPSYGKKYVNSVHAGESELSKYLKDFFASSCAQKTYLVIVGYSQGAHVAGDVYEQLTTKHRRSVAALVLLGDPRFNPQARGVNFGDYSKSLTGVYPLAALRNIPPGSKEAIHSYCTAGDPICNFSVKNAKSCQADLPACPHVHYVDRGWTAMAANWIRTRLAQLPKLG